MTVKRSYRRVAVKKISREVLTEKALERGGPGTSVGLDIGKREIVAVVRWPDETFEQPWSVKNPHEIAELVELLKLLAQHCDSLSVGLESTGTYGEAVRYAMTAAKLEVHRISGKASSDYKEIFDGVPSQHDGKDAAIIAELTSFGKGTLWPYQEQSEEEMELAHQVQRLNAFRGQATQWAGRLEGLLALHWPEATEHLGLNRVALVKCLIHYGSPKRMVADRDASQNLRSWGRSGLSDAKITAFIQSARHSVGLPASAASTQWIQEVASELHNSICEVKACEKRLAAIVSTHPVMSRYAESVGAVTLCVIWATVGDPQKYGSSGALLKALGLNIKELSSGRRQGQLAITKRGPSLARKYLYFWALRSVQREELRQWYEGFQRVGKSRSNRGKLEHRKMKGLVALMRKLCRALWYARTHDIEFEYAKVFPGRPLEKRRRRRRRPQCH